MAEPKKTNVMKKWGTIALLVCLVIIVIQNTQSVQTQILFFSVEMPRFVLLGIMLGIGFVVGYFSRGSGKTKA